VTGTFQRRLRVWLAAAIVAVVCWWLVPGSRVDHAAFETVARGFANPPFFISGNGSHASPWRLRTFGSTGKPDTRQAPVIVSLGDDIEGFFQSKPPSPIDLAVVLSNFQRLGARKAATATVLAWDAPDPIGLIALDKAISRFDSLVMAAPLTRGAVPEPMPPAFRNASVAIDTVRGDPSSFPVVNRIPITGVIFGDENTLAGFQSLESEKPARFAPLLARWEDRVVFAFPLLTVLQRLDLTVDGIEIHPGEYLKLGPDGPIVPIDRYGRLAIPLKPVSPYAVVSAEALIDGGDDLFPKLAPEPVVLRDDRSGAEPSTRAFSKMLPAMIAAIASDTGLAGARDHVRIEPKWELTLLALVAIAGALVCGLNAFPRNIVFLTIAAVCAAAQFIGFAFAETWLPGLPALAAVLCAALVCAIAPLPPPAEKPAVVEAPADPTGPPIITEPSQEPPEAQPSNAASPQPQAARKPPAKKAAHKTGKRRK
jgi:hypothetical protein